MAGCSQPGPAATVVVPPYQPPVPPTPSQPYQVSSTAYSETNADLVIAWGSVSGATRYELQHQQDMEIVYSGSSTSVKITNLYPNSPYTVRVRACNSYGCSEWSPWVTLYTAAFVPPTIDILSASFSPQYPSYGQGGSATVTIRNNGNVDVTVVISGKVFRSGTDCPVEGYFREVRATIPANSTVNVNVPYADVFYPASYIDWTANAQTCWQAGSAYGWLDIKLGFATPYEEKWKWIYRAIRLPD